MSFDAAQRRALLDLAYQSIRLSLTEGGRVPRPAASTMPGLEVERASFVTLLIDDALRGCCGSIEARHPIAEDVWRNAWASAFSDPRFPALTEDEYRRCDVHVSVLSELEPLTVADEPDLLRMLRPQIDGLVLQAGGRRATFLPSVWEQLPHARDFLRHLKLKAGWSAEAWPPDLRIWRYTVEGFGAESDRV